MRGGGTCRFRSVARPSAPRRESGGSIINERLFERCSRADGLSSIVEPYSNYKCFTDSDSLGEVPIPCP